MKNILITGCAGFIGFSLAKKFLLTSKYRVYGIDNLNKYYSIKLKHKRLNILKQSKNFKFSKIDLFNENQVKNFFKSKIKFDAIYHFAAQAGIRYTITNPDEFVKNNINGFFNLLEYSKNINVGKFFYASSSSIYGDQKKYPLKEKFKTDPKNIYGLTKKFNEDLIQLYSNKKIKFIGLRFFTVYGEWGRPDMLILKLLLAAKKNKRFNLYNNGNHYRDFTYIDDVVKILYMLNKKKFRQNCVYNVCSNNPVNISKVVKYINQKIKFKKIFNSKKNSYEIIKTHGDNSKLIKKLNYKKFSNIFQRIDNIIIWFNKYWKLI